MELHAELGRVSKVSIDSDDHGGWCLMLDMEYGGSGQAAVLRVTKTNATLLIGMLEFFGVRKLADIKGRYVNALRKDRYGFVCGFELPAVDGGKRVIFEDLFAAAAAEEGEGT